VLPPGRTVYLLGGEAAISAGVAQQVAAAGYSVVRLAGPSRVETALRVADEVRRLNPGARDVLVARAFGVPGNESAGWADSVTGGAYGARAGIPVVLTQTDGVHPATAAWLQADQPSRSILLGGTAALSAAVESGVPRAQRVSGAERTATATAIATQLWGAGASGERRFTVINGFDERGWAHGLAVAGLAADAQAPLLMVTPQVSAATASMVSACGAAQVDVLLIGGQDVIPAATVAELDRLDGQAC
jgi:putative cell wall-binding protein